MTDDTPYPESDVPAWTFHPQRAARERQLWPTHAEEYEDAVELDAAYIRRDDDPRPNVGRSCGGKYHDDNPDNTTRFECVRCGLGKVLAVSRPADQRSQIRFGCPACRQQTLHNPHGVGSYRLIPFDADHTRDAAGNALPLERRDDGTWVDQTGEVVIDA